MEAGEGKKGKWKKGWRACSESTKSPGNFLCTNVFICPLGARTHTRIPLALWVRKGKYLVE
jgi:hypothetical protein